MKQWEIYNFPFPSPAQPHPCVIISNQSVIDNADYKFINCLVCVSLRAGITLKFFHVRLNGADGLDGPTVAKCNEIYRFEKTDTGQYRGLVTPARRRELGMKLTKIFGLVAG